MKIDNLIGLKFGKLTVIERAANSANGKARWICSCECGKAKVKPVTGYDLKSGKVRSCGCAYKTANKGSNKTHGESKSRLYNIWRGMKARCNSNNSLAYENYGGRGITYNPDWEKYENFRDWALSNGYKDNLTLDRINTNLNYTPDNCRWATMKQQQNNRRNTIYVEIKGKKLTVTELSEITNIKASTLTWRLQHGWNEEEITMPVNLNNKNIRSGKYE